MLKIPFTEQVGAYGWGVWVEVAKEDFYRYVELYDQDGAAELPGTGTLANGMRAYPQTPGLAVMVKFQDASSRPLVYLPQDSTHPLAVEQASGIDSARYHQILSSATDAA